MRSKIENHKEHLTTFSAEIVQKKLESFRLKDIEMVELPFKCRSFEIKPPFDKELQRWIHPLAPISLDDLKNWFGLPNEMALNLRKMAPGVSHDGRLRSNYIPIIPRALPSKKEWKYFELDTEEQRAVMQMSKNLLYGYVEPKSLETASVKGVVDFMLDLAKKRGTYIFTAPDLVICPDETVVFSNMAALYFNNILIYGNGRLKTRGNTTIHALQIKRILL